jgi:predicted metal-dependent peptidase
LPDAALFDSRFDGMNAEEIYNLLPPDQSGQGQSQTSDPGGCGSVLPSPDDTALAETKIEWKTAVAQAVQFAGIGSLPADLARQIQDVIESPLPWGVLLRDFVERTARNDYAWHRPNPRYFNSGIILPGLISEELPEVIVAIDTSGSISPAQLNAFAAEASAVLSAYKTTIRVIYCDAKVHGEHVYQTEDLPIVLNPQGGGGTAFDPVFYYVNEHGYSPSCLIYLTDLLGPKPTSSPEYPVLWVSIRPGEMPFGTVIQLK